MNDTLACTPTVLLRPTFRRGLNKPRLWGHQRLVDEFEKVERHLVLVAVKLTDIVCV